MSIQDALKWGHEQLLFSSLTARLDAELLLSHALKKPVTFLLAHDEKEVGFLALWRYRRLIAKRKEGMPVAYLTGHKEFYFLDFEVNPHVLVPRPDTEILVENVISYLNDQCPRPHPAWRGGAMTNDQLLLDIGTGSACIPVSVLKNVPGLTAICTELSRPALRVARRNIKKHGLEERIRLFWSDLLNNVPPELLEDREVVVTANLPYIPTDFTVHPETAFEPDISLYGGDDGLDVYKRLMEQLLEIRPKAIFLELFEFQIATLAEMMPGYTLKSTKPLTGQARMMFLERK